MWRGMGSHMLSLVLLSLLSFGLALGARPASAQTPIFLLDTDQATFVDVFRVEPATGQLTALGSLPPNLGTTMALAAASDNLLYAVTQGGEVLRITVSPFGSTSLGNIGANQILGLAFGNGALYATEESTRLLYRIDLAPLSATIMGEVRLADGSPVDVSGGDLAQGPSGAWFLWTNSTQTLYTLDVTTGVAAPVGDPVVTDGFITGLAFDYQGGGALFASSREENPLKTLDPATGQIMAGMSLCVACPEPYWVGFGNLASPRPVVEPEPDPDPDPEPEPEPEPDPEFACPHGKGFWKWHRRHWPVDRMTLGDDMYGRWGLRFLLAWPVHGDASMHLAQALIAAKLSIAAGSDSAPVAETFADADALLEAFRGRLPHHVRPHSRAGKAMLREMRALDAYNHGALTPNCAR